MKKDNFPHQIIATTDTKSIPSMSFVGQIGHSEYSLKISQSIRKRESGLQARVLDMKPGGLSTLKLNQTMELNDDINIGGICGNCASNRITLDSKRSFVTAQFSSPIRECVSGIACSPPGNDTIDARIFMNSFSRVLSFMKLPFHNRSWFYGSVRFPVWENSYSDILIGFSTSCTSAAA